MQKLLSKIEADLKRFGIEYIQKDARLITCPDGLLCEYYFCPFDKILCVAEGNENFSERDENLLLGYTYMLISRELIITPKEEIVAGLNAAKIIAFVTNGGEIDRKYLVQALKSHSQEYKDLMRRLIVNIKTFAPEFPIDKMITQLATKMNYIPRILYTKKWIGEKIDINHPASQYIFKNRIFDICYDQELTQLYKTL